MTQLRFRLVSLVFVLTASLLTSCGSGDKQNVNGAASEEVSEDDNNAETKEKAMEALEEVNEQDRIFGVRSGKLTFQYSGSWTGTETVWFDQFGKRVIVDQDVYYSKKNHQKVRLIWAGQKEGSMTCTYTTYGEEKNECQESLLRPKDTELSLFAHGDESQLKYGYDPLGSKKILGKEVTGWQSKSSSDIVGWVWEGIDLAYSNHGVEKTVLSIEDIKAIPEDMFKLPEGLTMK